MEATEIWLLFGAQVYQGFMIDNPDLVQGFRYIFDGFTSEQRQELHQFLVEVLSRKPSAEELAELWSKSGAEFLFVEGDIERFFDATLRELEASIEANG